MAGDVLYAEEVGPDPATLQPLDDQREFEAAALLTAEADQEKPAAGVLEVVRQRHGASGVSGAHGGCDGVL